MLEAWLPLVDLTGNSSSSPPSFTNQHDDNTLPETCSISAIRHGLQPLPFRSYPTKDATEIAPVEIGSSWANWLANIEAVSTSSTSFNRLNSATLPAVKLLHEAHLPLTYPQSFYNALLSNPHFMCLSATRSHSPSSSNTCIIGAVSACIDPGSFDSFSCSTPTIHILSLVVDPAERRSGLASNLVRQIVRVLSQEYTRLASHTINNAVALPSAAWLPVSRHRKPVQIVLHVASDNLGALALYQKLGLSPVKTVRGYYRQKRDGRSGEAIEMRGVMYI